MGAILSVFSRLALGVKGLDNAIQAPGKLGRIMPGQQSIMVNMGIPILALLTLAYYAGILTNRIEALERMSDPKAILRSIEDLKGKVNCGQ